MAPVQSLVSHPAQQLSQLEGLELSVLQGDPYLEHQHQGQDLEHQHQDLVLDLDRGHHQHQVLEVLVRVPHLDKHPGMILEV